jgi:four helix bundle protein
MAGEKIRNFTDLRAWQEAHRCVLQVYRATRQFPKEERYCLTNQMRRAAISITSNIAEGFGRRTAADKRQFYYVASGSVTELQSQLLVARDLEYLHADECSSILEQTIKTHRQINGLISYVS